MADSVLDEDTNRNEEQSMPDAQLPCETTDSDSDSEDEAQAKAQIEALETELYNNPSDYDSHVHYIKVLRKQGDIEKLRQSREAMSSLFPLSPEMWREWAKDETTISSGVEAFSKVEKLYERGLSDYQSVDLWCDYLNFVQEYDPSVRECAAAGISKARSLFERAITTAGLHVTEGHRIWELYREFEQAIYFTIGETDTQAKEKQIKHIRRLFHRQLSVPLVNLESTLVAYKAWEADHGSPNDVSSTELYGLSSDAVPGYKKALEMLNDRAHLEENISKTSDDSEKLQEFMTYLKFEHSSGDPARIQILYERAIAKFPISTDIWLDYTQYLDKTFKAARIVRDAYSRATRNCPWVGELWVRYLLYLERSRASEEELSSVFEKSLQCTFPSFDEYLNIYLTRVDGLRRRISASTAVEDGMDYAVLRDIFQRASDYLSPQLNNTGSLLNLYSYWARLELKFGKDLSAARGVWESLIKICGSMLEAWQAYIAWEIEMGNIKEARSLYKRCYSKKFIGTGSEDICHAWVRFEREYGLLEDFDIAVQKVAPRLQELLLFRLQQESKSIVPATNERENLSRKSAHEKRKPTSNLEGQQSPTKRQKNMAKNLNTRVANEEGQTRQSTEASKIAKLDEHKAKHANSEETKDKPSKKPVQFDDQCTVFISNLNLQATADHLRDFFADVGGVVDVRILKDKFTRKSRGLAYVDFSDDAHLTAALEKNKQIFLGKKLSILKSDPQQGKKKGVTGPSARSEDVEGISSGTNSVATHPHKKIFLGKKLSILKSEDDQQGRKKGVTGRSARSGHGNAAKQIDKTNPQEGSSKGRRESKPESSSSHKEDIEVKREITFAVPRNVKFLGLTNPSEGPKEQKDDGETPQI